MFKLKRGRHRAEEKSKSVGLDYYDENPSPIKNAEIEAAAPKVVKALAKDGFKATVDDVKLALRSKYAAGQVDKAVELYKFYQEANEGILLDVQDAPASSSGNSAPPALLAPTSMPILQEKSIPLLGAENLNNVTCYLDSLLFAMYARLESFEPILYKVYDDGPLRRLSTLIRMWVNMLRAGKLITSDIMAQLRIALAENGWTDAGEDHQQDASEAFVFIAEKLAMPLLTLKMDIAHGGKEVADDDHKFVNERLLHVPVLGRPTDGPISLEACLEEFFANSVVVRREIERRQSVSVPSHAKMHVTHVESVEVEASGSRAHRSGTIDMRPETLNRIAEREDETVKQSKRTRDVVSALRNYSMNAPESAVSLGSINSESTVTMPETPQRRKSSLRTAKNEISLPAWTFLQLLPFYTDAPPQGTSAEHFAVTRPVLAICLKRYSWSANGKAVRNDRKVLIPEVIEFPHFVADDHNRERDALYGNFRLVLEAAVCHRGNSVTSGHYISLVRDSLFRRRQELMRQQYDASGSDGGYDDASSSTSATLAGDNWLLFDDLASPRVSSTTFLNAVAKDMPYLLFYRMVHIDEPIQLEQVISSESMLSSRLSEKMALSPSSTSTSMLSTRSVPTTMTGSSEEDDDGDDDDTLEGVPSKSSPETERDPGLAETSASSSLSPRKLHKRWRERSMSRKQSTISMPENENGASGNEHQHHHRHHHIHKRHHSKLKGKGGNDDDFDEEEKCVIV
ncbi:ubiquitin carboxyl-terminal hydrolase-domain-containing protein [Lipomyces tetrasporus]|uniref:ubiquitinyl hydrolase 1 n=1 Tax=Lipomyces tetrasporus TaxID=54092 RepID=A0AAD7VQP7_9ASCO|nr:ubiquitin carboxyl-terminal hydrolase-domain-containing protein [Lipomyces tetrasporus]KAJ8097390.1 ubiquitin carboxyl-terminal hydrolase-domain-containing protein [Lipomyces tetrasporus]